MVAEKSTKLRCLLPRLQPAAGAMPPVPHVQARGFSFLLTDTGLGAGGRWDTEAVGG